MIRITILLLAFLATLALALDAPIPGYRVEELTWDVEAFDDGTYVNITGTIQNVYAELAKINPDFPHTAVTNNNLAPTIDTNELDFGPICGAQGWLACPTHYIDDGISYLRGVKGKAVMSPGPGACARVSCSWQSAIWWCNDNAQQFTLDSFNIIADCAQVIVNDCTVTLKTVGQNFNGGNWNCIVRYDADNC